MTVVDLKRLHWPAVYLVERSGRCLLSVNFGVFPTARVTLILLEC
jgi:hypothetical protein